MKKRLAGLVLALCLCIGCAAAQGEMVTILGKKVPSDSTELTFSRITWEQAGQMKEGLALLPKVETVTLDHPRISVRQLQKLRDSIPQVHFVFKLRWNQVEMNSDGAALDLGSRRSIKLEDLRDLIGLMPGLKDIRMYGMRPAYDKMGKLIAAYPNVAFHWAVPVSGIYTRDDITAFSTKHSSGSYRDDSEHFQRLKYIPGLQAIDLGHNKITELSFLRYFPHVQVLILADNKITDVTEIGKLAELQYLELFLNDISDVTPLSQLANLQDLNLAHNKISDLTPLYQMKQLKRLWISVNDVTDEQIDKLRLALPDTQIVSDQYWSTSGGWRKHPHYKEIIAIFKTQVFTPLSR